MDEWDKKTLKAHQEKVGFLKDFAHLLDKYNVSAFKVYEGYSNYSSYVESIDIEFDDREDRGWLDLVFKTSYLEQSDVQEQLVLAEAELAKFESTLKTQ